MGLFKPGWKSKNENSAKKWIAKTEDLAKLREAEKLAVLPGVRVAAEKRIQTVLSDIVRNENDGFLIENKHYIEVFQAAKDDLPERLHQKMDLARKMRSIAIEIITDQTCLETIALNIKNGDYKMIAVNQLASQPVLANIARNEDDKYIRAAAILKLTNQSVIADIALGNPTFEEWSVIEKKLTEQDLLADIAKNSNSSFVSEQALCKITDRVLLEDVANNTKHNNVRHKASAILADYPIIQEFISDEDLYDENAEYGNTAGNINNGGSVATKGDWIFYSNATENGSLYKVKANDSEKTKLCGDMCHYINVVGDWVFFGDRDKNSNIYKIKTDGSALTQVNSDNSWRISVVGNWIYYVVGFDKSYLYKIRTDGTERTQLNNDNTSCINIVKSSIYYIKENSIYRMALNGANKSLILSDECYELIVIGEWMYYTSTGSHGGYSFYKIRTDGTEKILLHEHVNHFNIDETRIFYIGWEGGYHRLRELNPKGYISSYDEAVTGIHLAGDWIYYNTFDSLHNERCFKKVRINMPEKRKLVD